MAITIKNKDGERKHIEAKPPSESYAEWLEKAGHEAVNARTDTMVSYHLGRCPLQVRQRIETGTFVFGSWLPGWYVTMLEGTGLLHTNATYVIERLGPTAHKVTIALNGQTVEAKAAHVGLAWGAALIRARNAGFFSGNTTPAPKEKADASVAGDAP